MNATLISTSERFTLRSPLIHLGRASENQVVVNDPKVFPYHAQIRMENQGYTIIDLGNNTGTYINEYPLRPNVPYLLRPGDIIRLGDTRFRYDASSVTQVSSFSNENSVVAGRSGVYTSFPKTMALAPASAISHTPGYQPSASTVSTMSARPMGSTGAASSYPTYTVSSLLRKGNRRTLWIASGITFVTLLISFLIFTSLHSPSRMLDTYCNALKSGDYQTAYNQFAPVSAGTEAEFANSLENTRIVSCSYSSLNVSGNTATATVTIITASGQTSVAEYELIQDSSFDWKIYNAQPISN